MVSELRFKMPKVKLRMDGDTYIIDNLIVFKMRVTTQLMSVDVITEEEDNNLLLLLSLLPFYKNLATLVGKEMLTMEKVT